VLSCAETRGLHVRGGGGDHSFLFILKLKE
jgi:hypothetical protein